MISGLFRVLSRRGMSGLSVIVVMTLLFGANNGASSMDAVRTGPLPQPLPLFPLDNWWNLDIGNWPVDPNSAQFIAFINNGGTRRLHPDFGGNAGSTQNPHAIYGMPYVVVSNVTNADLRPVEFSYADESDGVDHNTDTSYPFYPIPPQAITQPYYIEGGDPGNVDRRSSQDRHLLIVDRDRNHLYELFNVFYDSARGKWLAGSGAFFDMNTNSRRPDTWTSADAAGLAILPGLVRYDEVYDPNIAEIHHAFRVTVRATNGYVYPASHRAGSTAGALPMGARLRLKASVDVTQRTSDPNVQKIFRAMQKYGLIIADNGSDMYVTGSYDTRWNNDVLNPAFRSLTASDFEVIRLGYNPPPAGAAVISAIAVNPTSVAGGQSSVGTVSLSGPAPAGGATIMLSSANPAAVVPATVSVPANATGANFQVTTFVVSSITAGSITASYSGVTKTTSLSVQPATLSAFTLSPPSIVGGADSTGTVMLAGNAPVGGMVVALSSSKQAKAGVPASVTVPAGASSASFTIKTARVSRKALVTITAAYGGVIKNSALTIRRR